MVVTRLYLVEGGQAAHEVQGEVPRDVQEARDQVHGG